MSRPLRIEYPGARMIQNIIRSPDKKGHALSGRIAIYYETFGRPENPAVILISGMDDLCTSWYAGFCNPIIDAGYYIIRFDNRDCGLSTWIDSWDREAPYTIEDMAGDALALLNALDIKRTHVIGASMGGMIAQRMAIDYPAGIITLTSVSSSGHPLDPECSSGLRSDARAGATPLEEKYPDYQTDYDQAVAYRMEAFRLFAGSRFQPDETLLRATLDDNIRHRNGYNPVANLHQSTAIVTSGSRLDELGKISAPTLIIHGTEDPLLHHDHSVKCARLIPGAKLLLLEGVGHEIPPGILPKVHDAVLDLFRK